MPITERPETPDDSAVIVSSVATVASVVNPIDDPDSSRFPTEVLPPWMAEMVQAVAKAVQVPDALTACCALAAVSASVGKGLMIQSGGHRTTRGNIYIVVGARSGQGKSESFRPIISPFFEIQQELMQQWNAERSSRLAKRFVLDAQIRKLGSEVLKTDDPTSITDELARLMAKRDQLAAEPRQLICEDVTSQRLEKLLSANNEVIFSASSEAGSVLNNLLGRYSGSKYTDENIYVKAFSGDPCRVDRIGRETVTLESPCLTALWLMQPTKLNAMFAQQSFSEGGLLPRIMPCQVETEPAKAGRDVYAIDAPLRDKWLGLILDLFEAYHYRNGQPFVVVPAEAAMVSIRHHFDMIAERRCAELADVDIYAVRWGEWVWRLSVVLHAGKYGAESHHHQVTSDCVEGAILLADWFSEQQLEILARSRSSARKDKEKAVLELFLHPPVQKPKTTPPGSITAREVQQAHIVDSAVEARALLEQMEVTGKIVSQILRMPQGGHSVRYYQRVM
jgi:hypothetical protein